MAVKSNKLYLIIDPEEGILLINMDCNHPNRTLIGATLTLAEATTHFNDDALLAINFLTEFDDNPDTLLRENLAGCFNLMKFPPQSGLKFCAALEQTKPELATSRRKSTYKDINGELTEVAGPPADK